MTQPGMAIEFGTSGYRGINGDNFTSLEEGVKDYVQNYLLSKKHL